MLSSLVLDHPYQLDLSFTLLSSLVGVPRFPSRCSEQRDIYVVGESMEALVFACLMRLSNASRVMNDFLQVNEGVSELLLWVT